MPSDNIITGIYIEKDLIDIIAAHLKQSTGRSRNEFINQAIDIDGIIIIQTGCGDFYDAARHRRHK